MRDVLVVGGGLAAFRFAQGLRERGYPGTLTIVTDEQVKPYDRPPLSKQVLTGAMSPEQCTFPGEVPDVTWKHGVGAASLDRECGAVVLTDGSEVAFEGLVIASGRRARSWPGPTPSSGVHLIRDLADAVAFKSAAASARRVVIIGAGFIGCEVAATLRARDVEVTVVDQASLPMPALGLEAGTWARDLHERHGVQFKLGAGISGILGEETVTGVELADGETLEADLVLVSIGAVPNTEWLVGSGVQINAGGAVVTDATCTVLDECGVPIPNLLAAGDVAAWSHPAAAEPVCIEHWSNARDMGDLAARNITLAYAERVPLAALASIPSFWSDQYNAKIKAVGLLRAAETWTVANRDDEKGALLVEGYRGDNLVAAVAFNMNRSIINYHRTLATPVPV